MPQISAVRGEITAIDDTQPTQQVQLIGLANEPLYLPRLQQFGLTTVPTIGTEVLVLFIAGRAHGYIIAADDPDLRPTGQEQGTTTLWDAFGNLIELKSTGIHLTPAVGLPVTVHGSLVATGNVSDAAGSMAEMRSLYNAHIHSDTPPPTPLMT